VQTLFNFDQHKKDGDEGKRKGKEMASEPEGLVKSDKLVKSKAMEPAPKSKVLLTPPALQEVTVMPERDPISRSS
jgi:hypothetical protein